MSEHLVRELRYATTALVAIVRGQPDINRATMTDAVAGWVESVLADLEDAEEQVPISEPSDHAKTLENKRNPVEEPEPDQADGTREPADDGKRYRVEYWDAVQGKWFAMGGPTTLAAAEAAAVGSPWRRVRIVGDTPEPQPEPAREQRYRVETWSKDYGWQWWSDWDTLERTQAAENRAGAMYPRVHIRIVAEHKPEGGAA